MSGFDVLAVLDPGAPWFWLVGGVLLAALELLVGGFLMLAGAAAFAVMAVLVWLAPGVFDGPTPVLAGLAVVWVGTAVALRRLFGARPGKVAARDPNLLDRDREP
jgi:membrane protein implicated in regulation of membrane protease activity